MKKLIHYTSLLNALKIISSNNVKFENLRNSNDMLEYEAHNEDELTLFSFCTSIADFDALMWLAYSKGEDGAALVFNFNKEFSYKHLFSDDKIKSFEIKYCDDYNNKIVDSSNIGRIKDKRFENEKEYRFLIINKYYSLCEEYRKINISVLESIDIIISPSTRKIVDFFLDGYYKRNFNSIKINVFVNTYTK